MHSCCTPQCCEHQKANGWVEIAFLTRSTGQSAMWFPSLVPVVFACFVLSDTTNGYPPRYAHRRGHLHQHHHAHDREHLPILEQTITLSTQQNVTSGVMQK